MPSDVLERELRVDRDALAAYAHVCGFTLRDELPPTYPHVLAFGLHMDLLAQAPFSAVGVVHIANRIIQHRPLLLGEALSLPVARERLRPHRRGRAFDFVTEVRVGDELVWEATSTNLKRGDGDDVGPRRRGRSRTRRSPRGGRCPTTSAAATPASRATTTRSTCTAGRRSRSASRARSPTGCGRRRAACPRCGCRTPSPPTCASSSRSCCRRRSSSARRRTASPSSVTSRACSSDVGVRDHAVR